MYQFKAVSRKQFESLKNVKYYFNSRIQPIYGDQTSALEKISMSMDRKCWLLQENGKDVGLLVHKNKLNNEYGLKDAFEIKTLFVVNPEINSGKRVATRLLHKVCKEALKSRAKAISVTASSEKPEVVQFFLKNGFVVKKKFHGLFKKDSDEYLLVHDSPLQLLFFVVLKLFLKTRKLSKIPLGNSAISLSRNSFQ